MTLEQQPTERAGDAEAQVRALYREHAATLHRALRRLTGPDIEAVDLLHDVFVIALRRADALLAATSPRAWLYGVALKVAADARRRARVRRFFGLGRRPEPAAEATPAEAYERAEVAEQVRRALDRLPAAKREVLVLFELEGFSGSDIAEIQGCPTATVWTRLHHARRALERELGDGPPELP